jgi:C-terminal processing protease CtpA/Prc
MPDGWIDVSQRVFVTGTNLHAEERLVQEISKTDREGAEALAHVVQRMRGAGDGHWVQQEYDGGWSYERPARLELRRPQRVAVLIDRRCGSACEQFLLTVRQSYPVKLVGRSPTYGGLDVSNLRPHLLPSGKHRLWYAITMSNRLPALPIDGIGIAPDVFLPDPEDTGDRDADVRRTQRWLEGGGW